MKSGVKTSEWWFGIVSVALMNIVAKFIPGIESEAEGVVNKIPPDVWAIGGTALVASSYAVARGVAKGFGSRT